MASGASSNGLKKDGLIAALLALLVGSAILYLFVYLGLVEKLGDGTFIAVIALPMIAYALIVYSDRVSEVSAGGVAVKFTEFANAEVSVRSASVDAEADIQPIQLIQKDSLQALRRRKESLFPEDKIAITFRFGQNSYYSPSAVSKYLHTLLAHDADMPVIFVDEDDKFVASTMGVKLRDALSPDIYDEQDVGMFSALEQNEIEGLKSLREIIAVNTKCIPPKTTNSTALEIFVSEDVPVLIAVDNSRRPIGVVRRDTMIAQMLSTLTES